jgi:hypothetical protein
VHAEGQLGSHLPPPGPRTEVFIVVEQQLQVGEDAMAFLPPEQSVPGDPSRLELRRHPRGDPAQRRPLVGGPPLRTAGHSTRLGLLGEEPIERLVDEAADLQWADLHQLLG